jgi:eukaryotic-like serine/threonine-protein kinase
MSLSPGTRIGAFEVTVQIGEGGMGEVYKATDINLKRAVAIKVLPTPVAADAERLARFQREAEVLATLNHPNIAQIHGLERSAGVTALVMELVEGPTLADRIAHGAIPLDEALLIAKQIADALDAAHEQSIVHRDLKPANIKVRPDGIVKVLDFGLAKALQPTGALVVSHSLSPTITTPALTQAGMVLGTAAYMSPEQAKGREADRRSDVWAFGCVLFEMLTGTRSFAGDDVSDTLVSVLRDEPTWSALPDGTPPAIRRLLRRCLEKDRARRLGDFHDARLDIDDARDEPRDAIPVGGAPASRRYERIAWLSGLVLVSVVAVVGVRWRPVAVAPNTALREMYVQIAAPPTSEPASLAVSPDGQTLTFVATSEGQSRLWLRPLNTVSPRVLPDTDGARFPFWSPDSRSVAFFADGQLKRIDIDGGSSRTLTSASGAVGGAWGPDGVILISMLGRPIMRASEGGGDRVAVTRLESGQGAHYMPQFLPDGRHFLYYAVGGREPKGVFVGQLGDTEQRRLLDADFAAVYASQGYLLFMRQGKLLAQRFDPSLLALSGAPFPLAEQVAVSTNGLSSAVSTSGAGVIAYRTGSAAKKQLTWFDRSGRELAHLHEPISIRTQLAPSLSPDGRQIALFREVSGNIDVWLIDTARGVPARFTFDSADDVDPLWSRDGRRIAFSSNRSGVHDLYVRPAAGTAGSETLLLQSPQPKGASDWSPDGRVLLYRSIDPKQGFDIMALRLDSDGKLQGEPEAVVRTEFDEHGGQFSPDGKWIAYVSIKSGRYEVYVQPFGREGDEKLISTDGGDQVRWRPDGKELFYVARDGRLMAVPVRLGSNGETAEVGTPVPLFQTRVRGMPTGQTQYVVSSNGQRFLMNTLIDDIVTSPITMILNWKPQP